MAKREHCGIYQRRFDALWAMLIVQDASEAGEISAWRVAEIIGCHQNHARKLIWGKIRRRYKMR